MLLTQYASLEALDRPETLDGRTVLIPLDKMLFGCRLILRPGASRLLVTLANAVNRAVRSPPVFAYQTYGEALDAHVLAISDPTLLLDSEIGFSVFLGTEERDPIPSLTTIAERAARALRFDPRRTLYWGNSGGGSAALMAACKADACAVAFNPQTSFARAMVMGAPAETIARVFAPKTAVEVFCARHPLRTSLLETLAAARGQGADPRLVVVQNTCDPDHYTGQYQPFCSRFDAPVSGGPSRDGKILTLLYTGPNGHQSEPQSVSLWAAGLARAWLERGVTPAQAGEATHYRDGERVEP